MSDDRPVSLARGSPETVLDPVGPEVAGELAAATARAPSERPAAVAEVAARHPSCLDAWAELAGLATDPVAAYAYARVGYHRGLDALRAAGWRGSGLVRWVHPSNRGFLRSVEALARAAAEIGETGETERCRLLLRQLDPGGAGDQAARD